jgi:hypothetical protein
MESWTIPLLHANRKVGPVYEESGNRGFLDVHIGDEGTRLVNGIYAGVDAGAWETRVSPTGQMTVKMVSPPKTRRHE